MTGYVDIHSHTLPGVDDGSPSFEISLAMPEVAFRFNMPEVAAWPTGDLADGRFVLTDFPPRRISPGLEKAYFELRSAGYKPILAHTERHRELSKQPEKSERLREQDLLIQTQCRQFTRAFRAPGPRYS